MIMNIAKLVLIIVGAGVLSSVVYAVGKIIVFVVEWRRTKRDRG